MSIEEITREVNTRVRDLLRRDLRPTHVFVDHNTYTTIRTWAKSEAFVIVHSDGVYKNYFNGLELHEVDVESRFIVVAP